MDKKDKILTAFAEEMQRHNSVKRRITPIFEIIILGLLLLFAILALFSVVFISVETLSN